MYEFVKTEKGWRIYWGVDPLTVKPAASAATESKSPSRAIQPEIAITYHTPAEAGKELSWASSV